MKKIISITCLIILMSGPGWAAQAVETATDAVQAVELVKTSSSWDGNTLPAYPKGEPEITILKITVPPDTQLPMHEHPVINAGVLIKGELTVITEDNKTLHMRAGDAIVEVVNTWHFGKNEGDEPAEILVFYAGVKGTPITINE